jgi:GT2 family glycosyltransferase
MSEALAYVVATLVDDGWDVEEHRIRVGIQVQGSQEQRASIAALFQYTPEALIDSWAFATESLPLIRDNGIVIVDDRSGLAGILALELANRRLETNVQLWTVAGSSSVLRRLRLGRSLASSDDEAESTLDWEITQYRFSDRVICRSPNEAALLAEIGVDASIVSETRGRVEPVNGASRRIYVPGPVSRLNSFPEILRAVADHAEASITFGTESEDDGYWSGTTWEAFDGTRQLVGNRLTRSSVPPENTDLVIAGDPLSDHDETVQWAVGHSIPVAAPSGSIVAQQWEGVSEWGSEDELSQIIEGSVNMSGGAEHRAVPPLADANVMPDRAAKVTVGIPVFGKAPYLAELIDSLVRQTHPAYEVMMVLDGPPSNAVKEKIGHWNDALGGKLVVLEQPNRGVCVARNTMLDAMTGDAVMLVDQDDLLVDTAMELLVTALRSNPENAAVACWTEFFGEYNAIEAKPPFDRRVGSRENPIVSTAALIDRSALGSEIRFEPDLAFLYCEDWNLWADLTAGGHTFGLVPRPLVRHRVHKASGGFQRTELALAVGRDRARKKLR